MIAPVWIYEKKKNVMNELAVIVDEYISNKGIKYQFIADKVGLSKQGLYGLMRKKNFSVSDANRILAAIDSQLLIDIAPISMNDQDNDS